MVIYKKYYDAVRRLTDSVFKTNASSTADLKRTSIYLDWVAKKTEIITDIERKQLVVPDKAIPQFITAYAYNKLGQIEQEFVSKFYKQSIDGKKYVLDNSVILSHSDKEKLVRLLVLIRGSVVWVEFGFNIGCEFGGKHPALILKNLGENLIVAPLSSQNPSVLKSYHVKVDNVYNLPPRTRWINVTRITPVSIYRVDFNSPVGSVKGHVLNAVLGAMKNEWS